ncbi:MAG TPA: ATP-binding protein, partial [Acidobacteriota bacterium]|nr:ATP-binding protein [Acidobacteriota bacterium]
MNILRLRILIPIFLLHLFALPLLLYQYMVHFEEPVWEALGQSMLAELQNRIAVHQLTGGNNVQEVQKAVDEFSKVYRFTSLRVYNAKGELRASHGVYKAGPKPADSVDVIIVPQGQVLDVTHWVHNTPSCQRCHAPAQQYIGVIEASISVTDVASRLGGQRKRAVFVAFATLLGVFGLISLFHYIFVVRPVKSIKKTLDKIKEGDFSVRVPVKRGDELGLIARNINEMVESLSNARRVLEEQHRERMIRAEQLATVGEIAAGLAHEVKNPLAGISSALEVLVAETDNDWPNRDVLLQIIEEAHRIAGTINRLLDYARPNRNAPDWWDLFMITTDIQSFFGPQCQKRKVKFETKLSENAGRMFVDAGELKQVLMNILLNALDAVESGGAIRLEVEEKKEDVLFRVIDNGPGMDASVRERIFQPFYTTKSNGTGLGLAIALRSVKDMGGTLRVESQMGQGT